jgi:hypothetical protein
MVMACLLQHVSDVGLTLSLQLVCQHREVRGNDLYYLHSNSRELADTPQQTAGPCRISPLSACLRMSHGVGLG